MLKSSSLLIFLIMLFASHSRDRIVVSTSRCGRDSPGSNPGHGKQLCSVAVTALWANVFFVSLTFSYLKVYLEGDHLLLIRKPYHSYLRQVSKQYLKLLSTFLRLILIIKFER